jgi:hypothetical protein
VAAAIGDFTILGSVQGSIHTAAEIAGLAGTGAAALSCGVGTTYFFSKARKKLKTAIKTRIILRRHGHE